MNIMMVFWWWRLLWASLKYGKALAEDDDV
jgi:hypothetical protein